MKTLIFDKNDYKPNYKSNQKFFNNDIFSINEILSKYISHTLGAEWNKDCKDVPVLYESFKLELKGKVSDLIMYGSVKRSFVKLSKKYILEINEINIEERFDLLIKDLTEKITLFQEIYKFHKIHKLFSSLTYIVQGLILLNKMKNRIGKRQDHYSYIKKNVIKDLIFFGIFNKIYLEENNNNKYLLFEITDSIGFHMPVHPCYLVSINKVVEKEKMEKIRKKIYND